MKRLKIYIGALLIIALSGCTKEWLEDYTADPSRPIDVSPQVLLPSAQVSYAMAQGDVLPRLSSIFMQQMTGTDRQSLAHNRYAQIGESDFDQVWGENGYAGGLYDLKIIIEKTDDDAPHYAGVARVMTALYLGLFTDTWGDIPWSEALQGSENYNPKYDSQEDIYIAIQQLLDRAILDLAEPNSAFAPKTEDLVYGGDLAKWTKLAYSLKARYLQHLSKLPQYNPAAVLAAAANGFTSNSDDASMIFVGPPNTNPWYQFNSQREGYITQFGFMYDLMEGNSDPRIPLYRSADSINIPVYGSQTSPLNFMTYAELKFIEAEAQHRQGSGSAGATLATAVQANMEAVGVDATDIATYVATLPASPTLEDVMTEKYIAMFTHVEAWTDWRRTGFPSISVFPGAQLSEIPRRLPYPEVERLYNSNFINLQGSAAFLDRHWWDL